MSIFEISNNSKYALNVFYEKDKKLQLAPGETKKADVDGPVFFVVIEHDLPGAGPANLLWHGFAPASHLDFNNNTLYKDGVPLPDGRGESSSHSMKSNKKYFIILLIILILICLYLYKCGYMWR